MLTPVYDFTRLAWYCSGRLKKDIGNGWTEDAVCSFFIGEEWAEERGMTPAELGEELIREQIENPEWQRLWLL
jgi:hypothetical protein